MILSAIAGWFVKRFWPTGVLLVIGIVIIGALIDFVRSDAVNSNRELIGLQANPNDLSFILAAAGIDLVINLAIFSIVWALRRKFKPHPKIDNTIES